MGKVSIIGSGNVGTNTAFFVAEKGITDVFLYDIQEGLSTGKALDMMEAAPIRRYQSRIIGIENIEDIRDSESVVIAAGKTCTMGKKPEELLKDNMAIVFGIVKGIITFSPGSIIIMATEPVDILTIMTAQRFALSRNKILGLGSIVDVSRLKSAVSRELSISAESIIPMAIGRHSGEVIVLPDYTVVSGIPLTQLLSEKKIRGIITEIKDAGNLMAELSECPGTYYTPSAAAAEVIDSIHMNLKRILSVSIEFSGEYGISGVAMSLPCIIGKNGVEKVLTPVLTETEHEALVKSADAIKKIIAYYNE